MRQSRSFTTRLAVLAVSVASLGVAGCAETSESSSEGDPAATIKETKAPDGTELQRITLSEGAVERLGIRLQPIVEQAGTLVVPYAAVVYDPEGGTWVYTRPKPNTFLRARVTVEGVDGDLARLSDGPAAGTRVVTVATAELYGAEEEIGA